MQQVVEDSRLYLPAEDPKKPNDRVAVHPETNAGQVLMGDKNQLTLSQYVGLQPILSSEDPKRKCLWMRITATN